MTDGPMRAAYYRPAEVARMLRCSEWWVKEQARRRRIPFCCIGGSYLFTEEHVAAIVRLFEVPAGDPAAAVGTSRSVRPAAASRDGAAPLKSKPPRRRRGGGRGKTAA